ncbi:hypothetical protein ACFYW8_10610 [Streptomyces sp. NPDC002742]|uniref:hypothetical protein n=1 Tax=Streptomyces sp. NPDC002742 TaxID=3364663 RepID=UPI0036AF7EAF
MNRRPTLLAAAALTAVAALSLSACGGGGDSSKGNDKIAGADTGNDSSAAASPTASVSDSAERPKIELPSDITYTFEWSKTGDADKDAVMSDSEQSIKAVDMAIANQNALDKGYLFYYEGEAAAGTQEFIQNYVDHKARTTGAYRFYDPVVTVDKDGTATLGYCEDQGKAFIKYLKSGEVKKTPVTKKSYVVYNTSLKKNKQGVWVIQKIISQSGSAKCLP